MKQVMGQSQQLLERSRQGMGELLQRTQQQGQDLMSQALGVLQQGSQPSPLLKQVGQQQQSILSSLPQSVVNNPDFQNWAKATGVDPVSGKSEPWYDEMRQRMKGGSEGNTLQLLQGDTAQAAAPEPETPRISATEKAVMDLGQARKRLARMMGDEED